MLDKAHACGLSMAKYQAYLDLCQYDDGITTAECRNMSMKDLHTLLAHHTEDHTTETHHNISDSSAVKQTCTPKPTATPKPTCTPCPTYPPDPTAPTVQNTAMILTPTIPDIVTISTAIPNRTIMDLISNHMEHITDAAGEKLWLPLWCLDFSVQTQAGSP